MAIPDKTIEDIFRSVARHSAVAVAVSGGPDSIALMHLVSRWIHMGCFDRQRVTVLTVDHRMRIGSGQDASFVVEQASLLGLKAVVLNWDHKRSRPANQQNARDARYALLLSHCRDHGITALMTAHTADDQAETFVMRLKRGSGLDGLASINPITQRNGVAIARPLLAMSKATLIRYLRARALPYVKDPSNDNMKFERVGIRQQLAALAEAGVHRNALVLSTIRLQRCRDALQRIVQETLRRNFKMTSTGLGEFPRAVFDELPDELRLRTLAAMIDLARGKSPSPRLVKIENALSVSNKDRWQTTLGGCILTGNRTQVLIWREFGRMRVDDVTLTPGESIIWDDRFEVTLDTRAGVSVVVRPLGAEGWNILKGRKAVGFDQKQSHRNASLASPAIWGGSTLVSAPLFGWHRDCVMADYCKVRLIPRLSGYVNDQDSQP